MGSIFSNDTNKKNNPSSTTSIRDFDSIMNKNAKRLEETLTELSYRLQNLEKTEYDERFDELSRKMENFEKETTSKTEMVENIEMIAKRVEEVFSPLITATKQIEERLTGIEKRRGVSQQLDDYYTESEGKFSSATRSQLFRRPTQKKEKKGGN
jgi:hypothetical protein